MADVGLRDVEAELDRRNCMRVEGLVCWFLRAGEQERLLGRVDGLGGAVVGQRRGLVAGCPDRNHDECPDVILVSCPGNAHRGWAREEGFAGNLEWISVDETGVGADVE